MGARYGRLISSVIEMVFLWCSRWDVRVQVDRRVSREVPVPTIIYQIPGCRLGASMDVQAGNYVDVGM